ncbi:type IV secretory system conjugative DNA transfer family protein [Pseudonocardia sp. RS010]|uniref:type IV secretory system conjugative DNA transfer family protein n=1 Tax=Pseudonocardia TaxID=1847 RepID=UPI00336C6532
MPTPTLVTTSRTTPVGGPLGDLLRDPSDTLGRWFADTLGPVVSVLVTHWPITLVLLAVVGTVTALGWRRFTRRRDDRLLADARQVTVLAPPTVDPAGGEALWANLVGLLRPTWRRLLAGQPHLVYEYVFTSTGATIRLWVPGAVPPGLVERAVEAAWPGSHSRTEPAAAPLPAVEPGRRRVVTGGELRLARPEALPLRTRFDADPVRALLGAAVGLGHHETACVQVIARPVTGRRAARARRSARHLHGTNGSPAGLLAGVLSEILDLVTPRPLRPARRTGAPPVRGARSGPGQDRQTALDLSAQARAVVEKQRGSQYETVVRYAAAIDLPVDLARKHSEDDPVAKAHDLVRGRAHALAASFASYTEHNRYGRHRLRHPADALAARRLTRRPRLWGRGPWGRDGDVLSVRELAALAHLPTDDHVPGLLRAGARAVAPPPGIATPSPDAKPLGTTDTGHERPVALLVPDARQHLHVIGATGSGKSTLLGNMILADADAGRGILLVDPKGDLVTDVLSRLPRRCADRVVLLDADARSRPPCLNPLDTTSTGPGTPASDLAVDNLVSVFRRVYAAYWGPRTDDVMRAACLTLALQPDTPTLAQLPGLLADPARRERLTAAVTDPVLAGFWDWYTQLSDASRAQVVAPLLNKLRAFLLRPFVREAIAAGPSTIDMTTVLDGGICLVRIPKGSLGEETTRLVGSLAVAAAWQATTARARTPQRDRADASLVIDECHNFLNLPYPIEDMLAEARGFRVAMTLAHQHLGQLPRELREGFSTNARSKIYFNAGPEDARDLARHTAPHLTDHDLTHLGAYHAAARLVLHGEQAPAFTLRTRPLPAPVPGRSREIRAAARTADAARAHAARERAANGRATATTAAPPDRPTTDAVDPRRRG